MEGERETETDRDRDPLCFSSFLKCPQYLEVNWSKTRSQELVLSLSHGSRGLRTCTNFCFLPWCKTAQGAVLEKEQHELGTSVHIGCWHCR